MRTTPFRKIFLLILAQVLLSASRAGACQCPTTELSLAECDKYEIIFRGRIVSVKNCDSKPGEARFEVLELFKGNATQEFLVLFDCRADCAQELHPGEEWIIYSRYKQIDNAMLDWCSRSRKYFKNEREDFYAVNYGTSYFEEQEFLRANLGQHRLLAEKARDAGNRNKIPNQRQTIITLLFSVAGIVVFYILFRRFLK